ncbi:hypothetical protein BFV94_0848 [Alteromonas macleodii]|uniref:Uncharacterized protein n=1 Tax=Alteromonas macleodii TaxID=28108 RepID=A0AB36FZU5_ALTMA|nr:hypothetical protein BFV95_0846 [Alteromonas macleodii]OES35517.1 hypothetical protein BFV94_0848 [Alteromonas macleodii]OES37070.1 hypothetical protein BFV93_0847 [Alteromonas macleodii]OES43015.1 hypothetical protein BFV96_0847 [Alteromonas macleodii]
MISLLGRSYVVVALHLGHTHIHYYNHCANFTKLFKFKNLTTNPEISTR